jgi:gas vesicle structural protein
MIVAREPGTATALAEVLDRVLDKGMVVDAWLRVSLTGIDVVTVEARVVIASLQTYVTHAGTLGFSPLAATPATQSPHREHRSAYFPRRLPVAAEKKS